MRLALDEADEGEGGFIVAPGSKPQIDAGADRMIRDHLPDDVSGDAPRFAESGKKNGGLFVRRSRTDGR